MLMTRVLITDDAGSVLTNTNAFDTIFSSFKSADMAELADAPDLGSGGRPCRFDSCYPHEKCLIQALFLMPQPFHNKGESPGASGTKHIPLLNLPTLS